MDLDRRTFLKSAGVASVAALGLSGCSPAGESSSSAEGETSHSFNGLITEEDFAESLAVIEPISDFAEEKTYDIVVVGAGVAGMPAVLTALEEGVSVCCLQRESEASANGNYESAIILEESDDAGILEWMQAMRNTNAHRVNWDLLRYFAYHSGETLCWLDKIADEINWPADIFTPRPLREYRLGKLAYYCHAWKSNDALCKRLAEYATEKGADMFYETPGVQLIQDSEGAVIGVIGQDSSGYIKFNANKGVILATGDYECNRSLLSKYLPDGVKFDAIQFNRTGDGHLMAVNAGGRMIDSPHCRQFHDVYAVPFSASGTPLLSVRPSGKRFMNEDTQMELWNEMLRFAKPDEEAGVFYRFFDSACESKYPDSMNLDQLKNYIVGQQITQEECADVPYEPSLTALYKADTIEELVEQFGIDGAEFAKTLTTWNEATEQGFDAEFGLDPSLLKTIDTPPYYGIAQHVRIIATNAGIEVDENYQAVDNNDKPIPGLFVVGTTGGAVSGCPDWVMDGGVSNGHCQTSGRYAAIYAATGGYKPSKPVSWDEVKDKYAAVSDQVKYGSPSGAMVDTE
ncbi:MAG: FAD-dependent oxidoreductase [Coriobacteriales bacterium]|jgi:succinate dehydrogenase/fumarate reductase flavoprotein subunit|nr:FAD-dependent oxidoreductase [Coriobacteriales bacterium]